MLNMSNKPINSPNKQEVVKVDKRVQAIELIALNPGISNQEICKRLGVNKNTMTTWRNNAKFNELVYNRFMDIASGDVPEVVLALLSEAKNGNVRAAELILKHFGKLQDTLTIKLESPYMQHIKSKELDFEDAEITEVEAVEIGSVPNSSDLPDPNPEVNKRGVVAQEKKQIFSAIKQKRLNKDQNSRYMLRKRAKAVGLEPLPAKKPTKTERAKWIAEIERLEKEKGAD